MVVTYYIHQHLNIYFFFINISTITLISGLGASFIYSPMFIVVSQYFYVKRGRALGIAALGSAVGTYAIPTLVSYMITTFGYQGCLLVLGGLMLNHCVSAALYRPRDPVSTDSIASDETLENAEEVLEAPLVKQHRLRAQTMEFDERRYNLDAKPKYRLHQLRDTELHQSDGVLYHNSSFSNEQKNTGINRAVSRGHLAHVILKSFESASSLVFEMPADNQQKYNGQAFVEPIGDVVKVTLDGKVIPDSDDDVSDFGKQETSVWRTVLIKIRILNNVPYVLFCIQIFTLSATIAPTFLFLPPLAKEVGISDSDVSILLAAIGASGFIGTFIIGVIFDLKPVRRHKRVFYSAIGIFHGVSTFSLGLGTDLISMAIASSCVGFTITSMIGQRANATSHYVTSKQLPFAFGLMTMIQGCGNIFGPVIQGWYIFLPRNKHRYHPNITPILQRLLSY